MKNKVIIYKRKLITASLKQCTEKEQKFFTRLYGEINFIEEGKLDPAMAIIERTLKNRRKK